MPSFFAAAGNVEPGLLCRNPAVAVNYMHAPTWGDQAAALERYWPSASTPGRLPVVVISVGFWEKAADVPEVQRPPPLPDAPHCAVRHNDATMMPSCEGLRHRVLHRDICKRRTVHLPQFPPRSVQATSRTGRARQDALQPCEDCSLHARG